MLKREVPDLDLTVTTDAADAVRDAVAVYTDVWASMGQEEEREVRRRDLADYQVDAQLMSNTQKGAMFMHCLPARRGEEVTDERDRRPAEHHRTAGWQPVARSKGHFWHGMLAAKA